MKFFYNISKSSLVLSLLLMVNTLVAQTNNYPKIGLTLSGGGARGLAHIGVLKAIDSAGLNINYVTGTSMGSVIGSLYAMGYSGKAIEKIARSTKWDKLLSNQILLRAISMEEKDEYDKYGIELPLKNGKLGLPTGALESEELWIKLSELYFPVYKIKQFKNLKIPFAGIATDITNAEPVVLDSGEMVTAIRASMAIPGVFTMVDRNGKTLVDGGVARNFPVSDAINMGANFTIGSNVSEGFLPKEKLSSPIHVLLQIASAREKQDNEKQIKITNIYINHLLENYSIFDFANANEIIDSGILNGANYYTQFKIIADSLKNKFGILPVQKYDDPIQDSVYITEHKVRGLKKISESAFLHSIHFDEYSYYNAERISEMIRRGYATRDYNFIHYRLEVLQDSSSMIIFEVEENDPLTIKAGIHYNSFLGISLIANLTGRNFITPNSRSFVTFNLGENFRIKGEHLQYFGRQKNFEVIPSFQYEQLRINNYVNFIKEGIYKMNYFIGDIKLQLANKRDFTVGLGSKFETERYAPDITSTIEINGRDQYFTTYGYFHFNTLDQSIYPNKGLKINFETGLVFNQTPKLSYTLTGNFSRAIDTSATNGSNFTKSLLQIEMYKSLNNRLTIFGSSQTGINFTNAQNKFNNFFIGGLNSLYHNQITFSGLQDVQAYTLSVSSMMIGFRYKLLNKFYIISKSNVLVSNFMQNQNSNSNIPRWITGSSLTLAYKSLLGPIEFSTMYSPQVGSLLSYVNIGLNF